MAVKKSLLLSLLLLFLVFFLPWLWGPPSGSEAGTEDQPPPAAAGETAGSEDGEAPADAAPDPGIDEGVLLTVLLGGELKQMDMRSYLLGVLRAEVPAGFETEALKAQAVAARTYVLYKALHGGSGNHPEADACDDVNCCQAYASYEDASAGWGEAAEENEARLLLAVTATDGQCVLYEGAPALAVFHSSSSGTTQAAEAVWSESVPYLTGVDTPEGEDTVPDYRTQTAFSSAELREKLQSALPEADLSGAPSTWFTDLVQQPGGAVTSLTVGGTPVSGNRLRTILGLRSACFTMSFGEDAVSFSVTGYGHGVGLSQYGANVLASEGMTYQEILTWYYTGTTVGTWRWER